MKLVFIIGTGRCGSTLLHEIVAKHRDAAFLNSWEDNHQKLAVIGRWGKLLYGNAHQLPRTWRKKFAPSEAYRLISRKVSPIYVRPCRDLTAEDVSPWLEGAFREFFTQYYKREGCPVFTHKYTGWSRIGFFSRIFPEAKFIHIVRDGRAVANSWLQMKWWGGYEGPQNWLWGELSEADRQEWLENDKSFVTLAGISWRILMESYENQKNALGSEHYLEIRYEDFLENPRDKLGEVLNFSGLDWTTDFDRQFNRFDIRKSRAKAYEKDLNEKQLAQLDASLSEMLEKYGYR